MTPTTTDRVAGLLLLALAAGCHGKDATEPLPENCDLIWERDVVGFFQNWCAPCHSATLVEPWRHGAPATLNLETLEGVRAHSAAIELAALGPDPGMPPVGGPSDADRALVADWIACGMKGTEVPEVPPCDLAIPVDGDHSVRTQAEADALCSGGGTAVLTGDLTVDATEFTSIGCVCRIDGDLVIGPSAGQTVGAPQLTEVGGSVSLVGTLATSVELLDLHGVGGDVDLSGQRGLTSFVLPEIRTVGGSVLAVDLGPLVTYSLPHLLDVGGTFVFTDAAVAEFDALRFRSAGGDVRFERLPNLTSFETLQSLAVIPGDLVFSETGVQTLDDMRGFEAITGTLRILGNPGLTSIDGFWWLLSVGGIEIDGNPQLAALDGFDYLASTASLEITASPSLSVLSFPALTSVDALHVEGTGLTTLVGLGLVSSLDELVLIGNPSLTQVDAARLPVELGRLELRGNQALTGITGFSPLVTVTGDLRVVDNPNLSNLDGLAGLATVGGDLELDQAGALWDLTGLEDLREIDGGLTLSALGVTTLLKLLEIETVGGDLTIRDNPSLPTSEAQLLADNIDDIGGAVVITGNAP